MTTHDGAREFRIAKASGPRSEGEYVCGIESIVAKTVEAPKDEFIMAI
jgi:hypothetical protein